MYLRARRRIALLVALALVVSASSLLRAGSPQAVGTWRSLGATPDNRVGAAAVALPDGRVLITGGVAAGSETASIVVFKVDPQKGTLTPTGQVLKDAFEPSYVLFVEAK